MATDYGSRLRAARKHAKLTQIQLQEATGIPQSTISTAERIGHGSAETPVYAKACGVDAHWLATGLGDMLGGAAQNASEACEMSNNPNPRETPGYLLIRMVDILGTLTSGTRGAAAELISEAIKTPGLAESNAAKLEGMLTSSSDVSQPQPSQWAPPRKQTPHAEIPGKTDKRSRNTGT
ncbi:hypothetical protein RD110_10865 [Rhodoferax koreense]|uniref:HTH cro/C1-type domain-containing protein n=2 Tax=Rhodoferax koreensis TaxID=1842727 RepID=A0A1P8JV66_9BURK|nr:hypothetical protein RD110_10865 [Rhodoferax koreense]